MKDKIYQINSKVLSALIYRHRRKEIVRLAKEFESRQWLERGELLFRCDKLTRNLVNYAFDHVPYYRNIITQHGIVPTKLSFPKDWFQFPLLDKQILRKNFDELKSDENHSQKGYLNHSGGSTGIPVNFLSDFVQCRRMLAWLDLAFSWAGWKPGEPRLELWGNKTQRLPLTLWDKVRASLSGNLTLPVYEYNESKMNQWAQVLRQLRPTVIYGYPSVLADFAKWLESEHCVPAGVKGVFCSAEVLYPWQRSVIEKVFGCKVYNQYGSRETPCIACECPEGGMHIFVDFNRIEFLDSDNSDGKNKEIIVTPLYNYAQPLLRYRIGDLGIPMESSCSCGRGYPLMELNVARSRDVIVGSNGIKFYPGFFTRLMDGKEWIRRFQFVQKKNERIELNIEITGVDDVDRRCKRLAHEIELILKEKMGRIQFAVTPVRKIDRTIAGKHRFVVSEIQNRDEKT